MPRGPGRAARHVRRTPLRSSPWSTSDRPRATRRSKRCRPRRGSPPSRRVPPPPVGRRRRRNCRWMAASPLCWSRRTSPPIRTRAHRRRPCAGHLGASGAGRGGRRRRAARHGDQRELVVGIADTRALPQAVGVDQNLRGLTGVADRRHAQVHAGGSGAQLRVGDDRGHAFGRDADVFAREQRRLHVGVAAGQVGAVGGIAITCVGPRTTENRLASRR